MAVNFDPSSDLTDVADALETVTLTRRDGGATTTIAGALRRATGVQRTAQANVRNRYDTWKDVATGGRYTATDVTWHLPASQLSDAPQVGDAIVDGDQRRWTILTVSRATLASRWQCHARCLALAHGLGDTITILQAAYDHGQCGAAEPTWVAWKTGIRARIQQSQVEMDVEHAAQRARSRYRIFVEEDLAIDHTHRVLASDGTVYRITGASGVGRIDELQVLDAEAVSFESA